MDVSHYAQFLSHLPVFAGLSAEEIAEIVRLFKAQSAKPGDVLCREGDPGDSVFVIETGQVEIRKRTQHGDDQMLATLNAPSVIGEMALLDGAQRSATAVVTTPVRLYRIECRDFNHLRANWSKPAFKVIRNLALTLCERLRQTNDQINAFFADPKASLERMQERQRALWQERQKGRSA